MEFKTFEDDVEIEYEFEKEENELESFLKILQSEFRKLISNQKLLKSSGIDLNNGR